MVEKKCDVKTTFFHGNLQEEVYMKVPEGYDAEENVCRLYKTLYRLKQVTCQWSKKCRVSEKQAMESLMTNRCIFKSKDKSIFLAIHFDDGIIF